MSRATLDKGHRRSNRLNVNRGWDKADTNDRKRVKKGGDGEKSQCHL